MRKIRLYNTPFDGEYVADVKNTAEALMALSVNILGFRKYLAENQDTPFKILIGGNEISNEEFIYPANDDIEIYQLVAGSGGLGKILVGAALMYVSMGMAAGSTIMGMSAGTISSIGSSLILGGISGLLFKPPKIRTPEKQKESFTFSGTTNNVEQGNAMPLAYGRIKAGSQQISLGFIAETIK